MKLFRRITEQLKKLDGIYGRIIKIYLVVTLAIFSILLVGVLLFTIYSAIFNGLYYQKNALIFNSPIREVADLNQILLRLQEENIKLTVTSNGFLYADNSRTAGRARIILLNENLVPADLGRWQIYELPYLIRRNITDFERNVNLMRAREMMIRNHIIRYFDLHDAWLLIARPSDNNQPSSVSLTIAPKKGSDITINRQKIEEIQKYLTDSIEGLQMEYIVITDQNGIMLNDF